MIAELVVIPVLRIECLSSAVSGNCLDSAHSSCGATAHIGFTLLLFFFKVSRSHTIKHTNTPLQEWTARHRGHYQHSKHKRRTSMPSSGFEPAIPAIERPQTHALAGTATGIGQTVLAFNITWRAGV
jgi:hypothetical protein